MKRSQDLPSGASDERTEYQKQVMLGPEHLDEDIIKSLKLNTVDPETKSSDDEDPEQQTDPLETLINDVYLNDQAVSEIRNAKEKREKKLSTRLTKDGIKITMSDIDI